jgi:hypothetical protein
MAVQNYFCTAFLLEDYTDLYFGITLIEIDYTYFYFRNALILKDH